MSFREIIRENQKHHSGVSWWSLFAYHYTDVTNAVSILCTRHLYSRGKAEALGLMRNDNASEQVIGKTQEKAISSVRFYFRPKTPTQYYNEGFKHPQLRYDGDEYANTPVPVFFVFHLESLLAMEGIQFSEKAQSGRGAELWSGESHFSKLNFDAIYSQDLSNIAETKSYRHAELLYPEEFPIDSCLYAILCRNETEKNTLCNLLRQKDEKAFRRYQSKIKIYKSDVFEENGLFVESCRYRPGCLTILFSESYRRKKYAKRMMAQNEVEKLRPLDAKILLRWFCGKYLLNSREYHVKVDYLEGRDLKIPVPQLPEAETVEVEIDLEGKLMCLDQLPLTASELLR